MKNKTIQKITTKDVPELQKMEAIAEADYKLKSEMREKEKAYYQQKMEERQLKPVDRLIKYLPNPSRYMKRGITYAHKDFEIIATAIAQKNKWAVVSGLSPTGPLHFGHKVIFDELLWLQKQGAEIYIPITNDEAYVVGKSEKLNETRRCAYQEVIPSIIAFGFDPAKTYIYVDSDYKDIYNFAMDISKNLTFTKVKGVFGFDECDNPGMIFYRSAVQLAQILLPQLPEFGGIKAAVVPVGIDQHPYILLARSVAKKKKMIPPAALYIKFLNSLKGPQNKMAASDPTTCIYLTDSPREAERKIINAFTGGSPIATKQKEKGGIPEVCSVFSLVNYHFLEDNESFNELYNKCVSGEILCEECKKRTTEYVKKYLIEHQKKMEEAKGKMAKYLLKRPIRSILRF